MLYYVSQAKIPSRNANSIQQVRMCETFADQGVETTLFHPRYLTGQRSVTWSRIREYYGVETEFDVVTAPTLLHDNGVIPKVGGLSMTGSLSLSVFKRIVTDGAGSDDIIYGRNELVCKILGKCLKYVDSDRRPLVCYELHAAPTRFDSTFFEMIDGVVCITHALKRDLLSRYDIAADRCFVAPDGVRLSSYDGLDTTEARASLELSAEALVVYTGSLQPGKGVGTLVDAAADIDAAVYIIGGGPDRIDRLHSIQDVPDNVIFTGFVQPADVQRYQVAADVLVAPYRSTARTYASPLKLFEYMAAGAPIVASDLPVLREVLTDGENCLLFCPDDPTALTAQVNRCFGTPSLASSLADRAREQVTEYGWGRRADRILSFCQELAGTNRSVGV